MTTLTLTPGDDGIAILSLSAGTRATPDFFTDLSAALDRFAGDDSQTGAILTGFPEQDLDAVLTTSEAGLAADGHVDWRRQRPPGGTHGPLKRALADV